tara:strand:+ start:1544 stop:1786 length:243 start_codon:yes stop_codon:yes gene_type:complete
MNDILEAVVKESEHYDALCPAQPYVRMEKYFACGEYFTFCIGTDEDSDGAHQELLDTVLRCEPVCEHCFFEMICFGPVAE